MKLQNLWGTMQIFFLNQVMLNLEHNISFEFKNSFKLVFEPRFKATTFNPKSM